MLRAARLALVLAVAAAASCGGNVVVDSTELQLPPSSMCDSLCATITAACPMTPPDCTALCSSIDKLEAAGACQSETSAYLSCLAASPSFLCMPDSTACIMQENTFLACLQPFCQSNPQVCM